MSHNEDMVYMHKDCIYSHELPNNGQVSTGGLECVINNCQGVCMLDVI